MDGMVERRTALSLSFPHFDSFALIGLCVMVWYHVRNTLLVDYHQESLPPGSKEYFVREQQWD